MATKSEIRKVFSDLSQAAYQRSVEKQGELGSVYLATRISGEVGEFCNDLQKLTQPIDRLSEKYKNIKASNPNMNMFELDSLYHNSILRDSVTELADVVTMCLVTAYKLGCDDFGSLLIEKFNEVSKKWESPITIQ